MLRTLSLGADRLALARRGAWKLLTTEERFWARVQEQPNSCWQWTGAKTGRGYGVIAPKGKRLEMVHRFAYELFVGPIAAGLTIDHLCRNQLCVNPTHLEAVTQAENIARGTSPPAERRRSGVCKNGHPMTPENRDFSHRRCKICNSIAVTRKIFEKTTHCPQGHLYSEFAYINARGRRRCSICHPRKPQC